MSWRRFLSRRRKVDQKPPSMSNLTFEEACLIVVHTIHMKWLSEHELSTPAATWMRDELMGANFQLTPQQAMLVIQAAFRQMGRMDDASNFIKLLAVRLEGQPS